MRILLALLIAATCIPQTPAYSATRYRYVETCGLGLCLVSADGKSTLVLAKAGEDSMWSTPAVSPDGVIAALFTTGWEAEAADNPTELYVFNPRTGYKRLVTKGRGLLMPESPVWVNRDVLLLEKVNMDGLNLGMYAVDIRSGAAKQVVKPLPDNEFQYSDLLPSPSGKLLATTLGVTGGSWISVNDLASGKNYWRTNPQRGMVGFSGARWSADSKSLFVAFCKDDELAQGSPGGLWKFDALTGKQHQWRYKDQSIGGLWSNPDGKVLALMHDMKIDYISAVDGKLLFSVSTSGLGRVFNLYFRGAKGSVICGTDRIAIIDSSGKVSRTYDVRSIAGNAQSTRYSPARNAVLYDAGEIQGTLGQVDLSNGRITSFARRAESAGIYVDWLSQDVVR